MKKTAILVVSFGTSYADTRKKTIEAIEQEIQEQFPEFPVYRAWTSGMIRKKVWNRDQLRVFDVKEAMDQMKKDGIQNVVIQPTHILNGVENDRMIEAVMEMKQEFHAIVIGNPLLTTKEDCDYIVETMAKEFCIGKEEALVFMGHGTEHYANSVYAALDYQFKDFGHTNFYMGTVEGYPDFAAIMRQIEKEQPKKIVLTPFMIVAGDHANNDLAGEEEDSWKNQLLARGYEVECVIKGLGEYPSVRKLLLEHVKEAMQQIQEQAF